MPTAVYEGNSYFQACHGKGFMHNRHLVRQGAVLYSNGNLKHLYILGLFNFLKNYKSSSEKYGNHC